MSVPALNCTSPGTLEVDVNQTSSLEDGNITISDCLHYQLGLVKGENSAQLISDDVRFFFEVAVMLVGNGTMSVVGIVGNCLNLIVFARSGFKDTVNMTLFGLSVADLLSLLTVSWCCVCYALGMADPPNLPFDPLAFWYVTAAWPHLVCTRLTCWVTALAAIERCLCVIRPFKVKSLMTPRRVACILMAIFTLLPGSYIPIFYVHTLKATFDVRVNRTRIVTAFPPNRNHVVQISYYINDVTLPTLCIGIVLVCTFAMTQGLATSAKWKQAHSDRGGKPSAKGNNYNSKVDKQDTGNKTRSKKSQQVNQKEMKVVKMVQFISAMFVVCFSPCVFLLYVRFVYPEIGMWREQHNMYVCLYGIVFFMEISNSSLNFFVYMHLSTNFKRTFNQVFNRQVQAGSQQQGRSTISEGQ